MPKNTDIPSNIAQLIADHVKLYLEHPERAQMWDSSPVGVPGPVATLLLTTKGRTTGKERHAPLLYVDHEGAYVVIGSKGGSPDAPLWYRNLQDDAACEVRVGAYRTKARARILEGEERQLVWDKVTERHPVYLKYQKRTERRIPVILLEPI
jgi:deazaflavin-dependent oxidoreductase (nitroreductase family)